MKGKICDWKDDKGFGFIFSEGQSNKIFFHISDIKTKQGRPKIGDFIDFDLIQDTQGRSKAKNIIINGLSPKKTIIKNQSNVEPIKKTIFDYIALAILFISIIIGGFIFYQTKDLNKIILYVIATTVALIFLSKQKKPKEKNFTCARCKTITNFDRRTIRAWNNSTFKLYCSACHQQWLMTQPETERPIRARGNNSGCLGVIAILTLVPISAILSIYLWLS